MQEPSIPATTMKINLPPLSLSVPLCVSMSLFLFPSVTMQAVGGDGR